MHNAQHDLMWLWECGFKYDGDIYDTMLAEYILDRGQRNPLSLQACAERRQLEVQKDDTLKKYFKEGKNTNEIPLAELCHYLEHDLLTTCELFHAQEETSPCPKQVPLVQSKELPSNLQNPYRNLYGRIQSRSSRVGTSSKGV